MQPFGMDIFSTHPKNTISTKSTAFSPNHPPTHRSNSRTCRAT